MANYKYENNNYYRQATNGKWFKVDRDKDGFVTKDDILQGISLLLQKDVDEKEVNKLITAHGEKLPKDIFVLAVANGELDKSLSRALEYPNINNEKLNTFI